MKKLLTILALGVAVKYFLDSDKGREVTSNLKNWLKDAQDELSDAVQSAGSSARKAVSKMN